MYAPTQEKASAQSDDCQDSIHMLTPNRASSRPNALAGRHKNHYRPLSSDAVTRYP